MRVCWVFVALGLMLSACQTAGVNQAVAPGTGGVTMSERSYNSFKAYLDSKAPLVFALSEDGRTSHWYYCVEFGCQPYRTIHLAITKCNMRSKGSPCHMFARREEIVWENPGQWEPLTAGPPVGSEDLYGQSVADIEETRLYARYNRSNVGQKAFAAARATDGNLVAVGAAVEQLTVRDAMSEALKACVTSRPGDSINCDIVEINNDFVGDRSVANLRKDADRYVSTALPKERQTITLLVDWDEVAPAVNAELTYHVPEKIGSFFLRLPQSAGLCKGTLEFIDEDYAAWTMACGDDILAEGTMVKKSPDPIYEGKGLDSEARQIRFLSVRPQG